MTIIIRCPDIIVDNQLISLDFDTNITESMWSILLPAVKEDIIKFNISVIEETYKIKLDKYEVMKATHKPKILRALEVQGA